MSTKEKPDNLILSLIEADLKNYRLLRGLTDVGLVPDDFYTDLSAVVFTLMGFKKTGDSLFDIYIDFMEKAGSTEIKEFFDQKELLALQLYSVLLNEKGGAATSG